MEVWSTTCTCTYIFYKKATIQLDITIKEKTEILYNISVNITVFFIWKLDICLLLNSKSHESCEIHNRVVACRLAQFLMGVPGREAAGLRPLLQRALRKGHRCSTYKYGSRMKWSSIMTSATRKNMREERESGSIWASGIDICCKEVVKEIYLFIVIIYWHKGWP